MAWGLKGSKEWRHPLGRHGHDKKQWVLGTQWPVGMLLTCASNERLKQMAVDMPMKCHETNGVEESWLSESLNERMNA